MKRPPVQQDRSLCVSVQAPLVPREKRAGKSPPERLRLCQRPRRLALLVCLTLLCPLLGPLLAGCRSQPTATLRIGSKKFTESVILGEIATQLLSASGVPARHRPQLGGTQVVWNALLQGQIDAYPDYTGTIWADILTDHLAGHLAGHLPDPVAGHPAGGDLAAALAAHGVAVSGPLGFNDTYAIGMKREVAQRLGIRTLSDLADHPELRLGFSEEFLNRSDGWPALRDRYHLAQQNVRQLDHDLAYRGLAADTIDATDLYSTDAAIAQYQLQLLVDDRHLFPEYQAVILYRADLVQRAPAAVAALLRLQGMIPLPTMVKLNARATLDKVAEPTVAADFLGSTLAVRSQAVAQSRLGRLGQRALEHLLLVAISLLSAIAVAIPIGIWAAYRPRLRQVILGVAGMLQTIPSLALLVFFIPLLGIGAPPAVAALFLYSLLPIVRNTVTGLQDIAPPIRESALALGLPASARLWLIELPLASRAILAGIKTSAVINVGTATLGAVIGAGGFGQPILTGIRLNDLSLILEGAVPAAALALLFQLLFEGLDRVLVPRGLRL